MSDFFFYIINIFKCNIPKDSAATSPQMAFFRLLVRAKLTKSNNVQTSFSSDMIVYLSGDFGQDYRKDSPFFLV